MPRENILMIVDHAVFEFENKIELQSVFYEYCKITANLTKMEFDMQLDMVTNFNITRYSLKDWKILTCNSSAQHILPGFQSLAIFIEFTRLHLLLRSQTTFCFCSLICVPPQRLIDGIYMDRKSKI